MHIHGSVCIYRIQDQCLKQIHIKHGYCCFFVPGKHFADVLVLIRWCTAQPRSFRSIKVKMAAAMPDPLATCMCSSFYSYRRYIHRSSRTLVRCICSMDMNKQFYCGNSLLVTFLLVQNDCKSATVGHILS